MDKELKENAEILLYSLDDSNIYVDVYFEDENFWLTQKSMSELFECSTDNISLHLKNIYEDEELTEDSTTEYFSVVRKEGTRSVKRSIKFYNLDAIIAVGYRVNSKKATRFRQWATKTLKEYITKGFVLNDDMLKNGKEKCTCKWTKCKRYGKCEECIRHHRKSEKYPVPFCMRKRKSKGKP